MRKQSSALIKHKVAREAATLLYTQQEKEYKQAKHHAANTLGTRSLPSNKDIALELDRIAEEMEGSDRTERLIQMRKDALQIMVMLGDFHPRLIGSVWRGTAHKNSDIDIEAFCSEPAKVVERLKQNGFAVRKAEWQFVTKRRERERGFHIFLTLSSAYEVELVVRSPEKTNEIDECEIYGDTVRGLSIHQLRRALLTNPLRKFVPL